MNQAEDISLQPSQFDFKLKTGRTPFSLYPLLFLGGAALDRRKFWRAYADAEPIPARLPLVLAIIEEVSARIAAGASDKTISNNLFGLKRFFSWADQTGVSLTKETLADAFLRYTEHLIHLSRVQGVLKETSAFVMAANVSPIVDGVLGLQRGILAQSRMYKPRKAPSWKHAQDTLLDVDAHEMGNALLQVAESLDLATIAGPSPLEITLHGGRKLLLGYKSKPLPAGIDSAVDIGALKDLRRSLINFRVEAEMLIFISQTGMNLHQARLQRTAAFHYSKVAGREDCLNVTTSYKARRGGEVEFEIFPEYRPHFLRYLAFRHALFPDDPDGPLFRFLDVPGRSRSYFYDLKAVKQKFEQLGVSYRSPRQLRKLRLNALLDATGSAMLVAEMGQHSPAVLLRDYATPSFSKSLREVASYHLEHDPAITPPGPGKCAAPNPESDGQGGSGAPTPNCRTPSGCLFCVQQRDIATLDHLWSLISLRHLKSIELSKFRGNDPSKQPALAVIRRISEKVHALIQFSPEAEDWRKEAEDRICEGSYHPAWHHLIAFAESTI